jgi:phosphoglycolate phosphatase
VNGHSLIAFDLDGTLIDSRRDLADSANALIIELGGEPLSEEAIGAMVGEGAALLVHRALAATRVPEPPNAVARFLALYDMRLLNHTRLYDGVIDAVRAARERAHVVVFTNKPTRPSERILEGLQARALFAEVIGGDNPYGRKPDPGALVQLIDRLGLSADRVLMVGDSAIDHETALRAGVRCCLCAFGYGFLNFPRERLTGGELIVDTPSDLTASIEAFASADRLG